MDGTRATIERERAAACGVSKNMAHRTSGILDESICSREQNYDCTRKHADSMPDMSRLRPWMASRFYLSSRLAVGENEKASREVENQRGTDEELDERSRDAGSMSVQTMARQSASSGTTPAG